MEDANPGASHRIDVASILKCALHDPNPTPSHCDEHSRKMVQLQHFTYSEVHVELKAENCDVVSTCHAQVSKDLSKNIN